MQVRGLQFKDIPAIRKMYEESGFAYDFPDFYDPMFEGASVVVDDNDNPIMMAAAERIVQLYLICDKTGHPAARLHAIRLLHEDLRPKLAAKGYRSAEAFIPPQIEKTFSKRLAKTFNWTRNWTSWCVKV